MVDRSFCFDCPLKSSSKFISHIYSNRQYTFLFNWVLIVLVLFFMSGCSTFKQYNLNNYAKDGNEISLSEAQKSLQAFFLKKRFDIWKEHKAYGTSEDYEKIVVTQDAIKIIQKKDERWSKEKKKTEENYFHVHNNKYRFKLYNNHTVKRNFPFNWIKIIAKFPSNNLNNKYRVNIVIYLCQNEALYYSIRTGNQINESDVYTKWARHFDKIPYSSYQEYTIRFPYEDKPKMDYIIKCISVLKNVSGN